MPPVKPFGILIEARGEGGEIAGIADIAVIARDRKSKISPLINTDDTDQEEIAGIGNGPF